MAGAADPSRLDTKALLTQARWEMKAIKREKMKRIFVEEQELERFSWTAPRVIRLESR